MKAFKNKQKHWRSHTKEHQHTQTNNVKTNTNIPNNYAILLEATGDSEAAKALRASIVNYNDKTPYAWLKLGYESAQKNNDRAAIRYFNKAIELAPYLDELYFALAKSLYRERRYSQAAEAMKTAAETTWKKSKRSLYYAKLSALKMRVFE